MMIKFDINGAIIEFDACMYNYNEIRKTFKLFALQKTEEFKEYLFNNAVTLNDLSDKSSQQAQKHIEEAIRKGVETLVSYKIITIDQNTFNEMYCKKYINYQRMLNNISKQSKSRSKRSSYLTVNSLKPLVEEMANYIYNDCFNMHLAVIDALIENDVDNISRPINDDSIRISSALFNNYKDGFISQEDEHSVISQIITSNPYRIEVYEYLLREEGDFSKEIERLVDFLGYDIKPLKEELIDKYITDCIKENNNDVEFIKEKVIKYARYIGCSSEEIYETRIDAIFMFANA